MEVVNIWHGLMPSGVKTCLQFETLIDSKEQVYLQNEIGLTQKELITKPYVDFSLKLPYGLTLCKPSFRKLSETKGRWLFTVENQTATGNIHPEFYIDKGKVIRRLPFGFGTEVDFVTGRTFLTSDLHFFHKTVLQFSKTSREFNDLDEMHEAYIKMWNDTVKPCDNIIVLGDFSMKGVEATRNLLSKLNGRIIFVEGNHDRKMLKTLGFKSYPYLELRFNTNLVCLMHFPIHCWNGQARGSVHFHGHTHARYSGAGRSLDVGIDNLKRIIPFEDAYNVARSRTVVCPDERRLQ